MGENFTKLEFNMGSLEIISLYTKLKKLIDDISKIQIVYKQDNYEHITENISLEWFSQVDSHEFYIWYEFKLAQKQKYNIRNYEIVLEVWLSPHTNR